MKYAGIVHSDMANGPGVRVSVFVSGCRNACPGCFNPEAQSFDYGLTFGNDAVDTVIRALDRPEIQGLTVLGGEPLEPENQHMLLRLLQRAKMAHPEKDIWLYTGFTYEDLRSPDSRANTEYLRWILELVDVLVDGPFMQDLRDLTLKFRGSSNQRLIDLRAMRAAKDADAVICVE